MDGREGMGSFYLNRGFREPGSNVGSGNQGGGLFNAPPPGFKTQSNPNMSPHGHTNMRVASSMGSLFHLEHNPPPNFPHGFTMGVGGGRSDGGDGGGVRSDGQNPPPNFPHGFTMGGRDGRSDGGGVGGRSDRGDGGGGRTDGHSPPPNFPRGFTMGGSVGRSDGGGRSDHGDGVGGRSDGHSPPPNFPHGFTMGVRGGRSDRGDGGGRNDRGDGGGGGGQGDGHNPPPKFPHGFTMGGSGGRSDGGGRNDRGDGGGGRNDGHNPPPNFPHGFNMSGSGGRSDGGGVGGGRSDRGDGGGGGRNDGHSPPPNFPHGFTMGGSGGRSDGGGRSDRGDGSGGGRNDGHNPPPNFPHGFTMGGSGSQSDGGGVGGRGDGGGRSDGDGGRTGGGGGSAASIATPGSVAEPLVKKKRGRPRKYAPEGSRMALGLTPVSSSEPSTPTTQKKRGRPRGSGRKQRLANVGEWMHNSAGSAFTPHIIHISVGEDVAEKILLFAQQRQRALCILSGNGTVSTVTLRQSASSSGTMTHEGTFEILCLSGSYLLAETGSPRDRTGGLSISVLNTNGQVIGGAIGGQLIASSLIQVVVGSFVFGGGDSTKAAKTAVEPPSGDEKSHGVEPN